MKQRFTKLLAAFALLVFMMPSLAGWGQSVDGYTATSADKPTAVNGTTTGTVTGTNSISWSYSVTQQTKSGKSPYVAYGEDYGWQLGSSNSPCKAFSISTSGITGTITQIQTVTGSASASSKISVTVGGEAFGEQNQTTGSGNAVTSQTFTGSASGTIVVTASASNAAFYFKSVTVTYSTGGAPTPSMSVSTNSIDFGSNPINPSEPYTETFNVTFANLTENLTVTGFSGVTVSPATINANATSPQTVTVSYNPTSAGSISGNISVNSTEVNEQLVAVTGSAYDPASAVFYEIINEAPQDWSGKYIITAIKNDKHNALTGVSDNIGTCAEVTVSEGEIISNSTTDSYAVLIAPTTNNKYSLRLDGKYLYAQSSNNLYSQDAFEEGKCEWTLSFEDELVQITNVAQSTRRIQFNSGSPRFACYTGTQTDLNLFRYQGTVALPLSAPVISVESGNGTITPSWNAITGAESYTLQYGSNQVFSDGSYTEVLNATSGNPITVTNGEVYYVRVKAIGDGENNTDSGWSNVATGNPVSPCQIVYHVNGTVNASLTPATVSQGSAIGQLPTVEDILDYAFAGWSTSENNISIIDATYIANSETLNLYAVYSKSVEGATTTAYSRINSTSDVSNGDYLIVYGDALVAFDGSLTSLDVANNTIDVEIENGVIDASDEIDASAFTINAISGGYSIKSASGLFIGAESYNNELKTNETDAYINSISFNGNNVLMQMSFSGGTVTLKFNAASNQSRFRYYKSGQQDIQLYKKTTITTTTTAHYTRICTKDITGYGTDHAVENGWYLIASPVANDVTPSADNGFITDYYDLYRFNQTAELEWENHEVHGFDIESGRGYLYASSTNTTLVFAGTPYNGDGVVELNHSQNAFYDGFNLVGNPLATSATINLPFYKMNDGHTALTSKLESGTIAAMEGAFVYAYDETTQQAISSVTFTASRSRGNSNASVNIDVMHNGAAIDNAIVRFDEGRQLPKYQLFKNSTKLFITKNSKDYAIVNSEAQGEMPVNFKAEENGTYTLSINTENVEMNYLHLIDNMTGMDVDLLQTPSYTFDATTNDYTSRFRLVFSANNVDGPSTGSGTFAFYSNGNWVIGNEGEATLQVIDVNGRIVSNETINGSVATSINATPGVYMLRLVNGNEVKTQKIVVR